MKIIRGGERYGTSSINLSLTDLKIRWGRYTSWIVE